jgi:sulfotransferase family protein
MNVPRNIIWIGSFPKSGNTWVRAFLGNYFQPTGKLLSINELSSITTSDVRQDWFDKAAGGAFAGKDFDHWISVRNKVLQMIAGSSPGNRFVKTHSKIDRIGDIDLIMPQVTAAAICIIRNPFDVAVSFARHSNITIDVSIDRLSDPRNISSTDTGILEVMGRWDDHVQSWTKAPGLPYHLMRYEDMVDNPKIAYKALLKFLQVPVEYDKFQKALKETSFSAMQKQESSQGFREKPPGMDKFFSTGKYGGWKDSLTPAQVARIHEEFKPTIDEFFPEVGEQASAFIAQTQSGN